MKIIANILADHHEFEIESEDEFNGHEMFTGYFLDLRDLPKGNGAPFIINLPTPLKEPITLEPNHPYPLAFAPFFAQTVGPYSTNSEIRVNLILEGGRAVIMRPGFKLFQKDAVAESNLTEIFTNNDGLSVRVTLVYVIDSYVLESVFPETKNFQIWVNFNRLGSERGDPIVVNN